MNGNNCNAVSFFKELVPPRTNPTALECMSSYLRESLLGQQTIPDPLVLRLCEQVDCRVMSPDSILCVQGRAAEGVFLLLEGEVAAYGCFESSTRKLLRVPEMSNKMISRLSGNALFNFLGTKLRLFQGPSKFIEGISKGKIVCYSCICQTECVVLHVKSSLYRDCIEEYHRKFLQGHSVKMDLLKSMQVCQGWDESRLSQLANELAHAQFQRGDVVVEQGKHIKNLFIIDKGEIKMTERFLFNLEAGSVERHSRKQPSDSQKEVLCDVSNVRHGCFIGDIEMIKKSKVWCYTYTAQERTEIYCMKPSTFGTFFMRAVEEQHTLEKIKEIVGQNLIFFDQKISKICTQFSKGQQDKRESALAPKNDGKRMCAFIKLQSSSASNLHIGTEEQHTGIRNRNLTQEEASLDKHFDAELQHMKAVAHLNSVGQTVVRAVPSLSRMGSSKALNFGQAKTTSADVVSKLLLNLTNCNTSREEAKTAHQRFQAFEKAADASLKISALIGETPELKQGANILFTGNIQQGLKKGTRSAMSSSTNENQRKTSEMMLAPATARREHTNKQEFQLLCSPLTSRADRRVLPVETTNICTTVTQSNQNSERVKHLTSKSSTSNNQNQLAIRKIETEFETRVQTARDAPQMFVQNIPLTSRRSKTSSFEKSPINTGVKVTEVSPPPENKKQHLKRHQSEPPLIPKNSVCIDNGDALKDPLSPQFQQTTVSMEIQVSQQQKRTSIRPLIVYKTSQADASPNSEVFQVHISQKPITRINSSDPQHLLTSSEPKQHSGVQRQTEKNTVPDQPQPAAKKTSDFRVNILSAQTNRFNLNKEKSDTEVKVQSELKSSTSFERTSRPKAYSECFSSNSKSILVTAGAETTGTGANKKKVDSSLTSKLSISQVCIAKKVSAQLHNNFSDTQKTPHTSREPLSKPNIEMQNQTEKWTVSEQPQSSKIQKVQSDLKANAMPARSVRPKAYSECHSMNSSTEQCLLKREVQNQTEKTPVHEQVQTPKHQRKLQFQISSLQANTLDLEKEGSNKDSTEQLNLKVNAVLARLERPKTFSESLPATSDGTTKKDPKKSQPSSSFSSGTRPVLFTIKFKVQGKVCRASYFEGETPLSAAESFLSENHLQEHENRSVYLQAVQDEISKRLAQAPTDAASQVCTENLPNGLQGGLYKMILSGDTLAKRIGQSQLGEYCEQMEQAQSSQQNPSMTEAPKTSRTERVFERSQKNGAPFLQKQRSRCSSEFNLLKPASASTLSEGFLKLKQAQKSQTMAMPTPRTAKMESLVYEPSLPGLPGKVFRPTSPTCLL